MTNGNAYAAVPEERNGEAEKKWFAGLAMQAMIVKQDIPERFLVLCAGRIRGGTRPIAEFPELTFVRICPHAEVADVYRQTDRLDNLVSSLNVTRR